MAYRKFKADRLFDGYKFREGDAILITDLSGKIENIVTRAEAGDEVEELKGILCPGFINCHVHLELSHMRGKIPERTGLEEFVYSIITQRFDRDEEILLAIEAAEDEMLLNGIVAAGDICNNILTIPQKRRARLYYHNFIEASGFHPAVSEPRFERSLEIYNEYQQLYNGTDIRGTNSIVPHAAYSVSDDLWDLLIHFPNNNLFTIHNQESMGEDEWFMNKSGPFHNLYEQMTIDTSFFRPTGKSSLQNYLPKFLSNQQVILVHNVHTTKADVDFAKKTSAGENIFWCLCVNANRYITGNLPDINMLVNENCQIVLGTDSLASNHELSILEEIKTIKKKFPEIDLDYLLKWATSNGAAALKVGDMLGSFEPGKHPGVILIDSDLMTVGRII